MNSESSLEMHTKTWISSRRLAVIGRNGWRFATFVWVCALVGVFGWITRYEFSTYADERSATTELWPTESSLDLCAERSSLLLFVHPRCPCTRATIRELERVLRGPDLTVEERPKLIVIVSLPLEAGEDWLESDTVRQALDLPNATSFLDFGGVESERFGAVASGTVMLYSNGGQQLYAGGVTASRGHEGENLGTTQLRNCIHDPSVPSKLSIPAFGCRLCRPLGESQSNF